VPLKPTIRSQRPSDDTMLDQIQQESFPYFLEESNLENGLIRDKNKKEWPASITAIGLALACYPIGVERGCLTRDDAIKRALATLRFFLGSRDRISGILLSFFRHADRSARLEIRAVYH
jgi:hypothetical protein